MAHAFVRGGLHVQLSRERQPPHLKLGKTKTDCKVSIDNLEYKSSGLFRWKALFFPSCDHDIQL